MERVWRVNVFLVLLFLLPGKAHADLAPAIPPLGIAIQAAYFLAGVAFLCSLIGVLSLWHLSTKRNSSTSPAGLFGWGLRLFYLAALLFVILFSMNLQFMLGPLYEIPIGIYLALSFLFLALKRRQPVSEEGAPKEAAVRPGFSGRFWFNFALLFSLVLVRSLATIGPSLSDDYFSKRGPAGRRSQMANIKTALVNFNNDTGRFPHFGIEPTRENFDGVSELLLGTSRATNILVNPNRTGEKVASPPMGVKAFQKRWKVPYLDGEPEEFMVDGFGNPIRLLWSSNTIYLHSAGKDKSSDPMDHILKENYQGDDTVLSVSRIKSHALPASSP